MKTVVAETFGPPNALKEIEVPVPEPRGGEVLVRFLWCGLVEVHFLYYRKISLGGVSSRLNADTRLLVFFCSMDALQLNVFLEPLDEQNTTTLST